VLQFRLGPFPVRIELSFLIAAALLGGLGNRSVADVASWIVLVFISVLVHELGHALVGLSQGGRPEIILQWLGGVTFPRLRSRTTWAQQIWLSVAGPLAGLLPGAIAVAVLIAQNPELGQDLSRLPIHVFHGMGSREPLTRWLAALAVMSVFWTALNLMPVFPLDGGHVLEIALTAARKKPSTAIASWISAVVGAALGVLLLLVGQLYAALYFGAQVAANIGRARAASRGNPGQARPAGPDTEARSQVAQALELVREALGRNDFAAALQLAAQLEGAPDGYRQSAGARIRAGVALFRGEYMEAGRQAGRSYSLAPHVEAAVLASRAALRGGQREIARTWLQRAVEAGAKVDDLRSDPELAALA